MIEEAARILTQPTRGIPVLTLKLAIATHAIIEQLQYNQPLEPLLWKAVNLLQLHGISL